MPGKPLPVSVGLNKRPVPSVASKAKSNSRGSRPKTKKNHGKGKAKSKGKGKKRKRARRSRAEESDYDSSAIASNSDSDDYTSTSASDMDSDSDSDGSADYPLGRDDSFAEDIRDVTALVSRTIFDRRPGDNDLQSLDVGMASEFEASDDEAHIHPELRTSRRKRSLSPSFSKAETSKRTKVDDEHIPEATRPTIPRLSTRLDSERDPTRPRHTVATVTAQLAEVARMRALVPIGASDAWMAEMFDHVFVILAAILSSLEAVHGDIVQSVKDNASVGTRPGTTPHRPTVLATSASEYERLTGTKVHADVLWSEADARAAFAKHLGVATLRPNASVPFAFLVRDASGNCVSDDRMKAIRSLIRDVAADLEKLPDKRVPTATGALRTRCRTYFQDFHRFEFLQAVRTVESGAPELAFCTGHYKAYNGLDRRLRTLAEKDVRQVCVKTERDDDTGGPSGPPGPSRASVASEAIPSQHPKPHTTKKTPAKQGAVKNAAQVMAKRKAAKTSSTASLDGGGKAGNSTIATASTTAAATAAAEVSSDNTEHGNPASSRRSRVGVQGQASPGSRVLPPFAQVLQMTQAASQRMQPPLGYLNIPGRVSGSSPLSSQREGGLDGHNQSLYTHANPSGMLPPPPPPGRSYHPSESTSALGTDRPLAYSSSQPALATQTPTYHQAPGPGPSQPPSHGPFSG